MIFKDKIEYSNYNSISPKKVNELNLFDCFHGILFYIYYNSENKLNINELEFHYSGGSRRNNYSSNQQNDQSNILSIFNYENIITQFRIETTRNAFFGITFKRIKINPISYSIRSGLIQNNVSHLVSFTFEGYDETSKQWDVLDERVNINNLIFSGGFQMFFVHSTSKYYSSFQIKQTEPGNNGFWGFSIAAFDIHGIVSISNDELYDDDFLFKQSNSSELFECDKYNPMIDMTEYII